ncbi:MAG: glycosyltransferase family 2 protein, partial [Bacteroidota bacterium]
MPFFSIILPSYNRAHFLPKAIESVQSQIFENWELIVVDDGSKDDTKEVVSYYIQSDGRIRYIWQENAERSAARNNGIRQAKGEYICFLDSDDYYLPNHLSSFYKLIKEKELSKAFLFGNTFEDYRGKLLKVPVPHLPIKYNAEFFLLNTIGVPRACIHKKILEKYSFNTSVRVGEDTELWVRIAMKYPVYYN